MGGELRRLVAAIIGPGPGERDKDSWETATHVGGSHRPNSIHPTYNTARMQRCFGSRGCATGYGVRTIGRPDDLDPDLRPTRVRLALAASGRGARGGAAGPVGQRPGVGP